MQIFLFAQWLWLSSQDKLQKKICGKYSRLKFDLFNGKLAFKYEKSFNSSVEINNYKPES